MPHVFDACKSSGNGSSTCEERMKERKREGVEGARQPAYGHFGLEDGMNACWHCGFDEVKDHKR